LTNVTRPGDPVKRDLSLVYSQARRNVKPGNEREIITTYVRTNAFNFVENSKSRLEASRQPLRHRIVHIAAYSVVVFAKYRRMPWLPAEGSPVFPEASAASRFPSRFRKTRDTPARTPRTFECDPTVRRSFAEKFKLMAFR